MKQLLVVLIGIIILFGCTKEDEILYEGKLDFSTDTTEVLQIHQLIPLT